MAFRTLVGMYAPGDYRIRTSKPGYNALAALDPERLSFDSNWQDVGIVMAKGTVAVPRTSQVGQYWAFIDVGIAFPTFPIVFWWIKESGNVYKSGSYWVDPDVQLNYYEPYCMIYSGSTLGFRRDDWNSRDYTAAFVVLRGFS